MNADNESVFFNIGSDVSSSINSLQNLSKTLENLSNLLTSGTNKVNNFTNALKSLSSINVAQIQNIVANLNAINNFKASNELNHLANTLENVANMAPKINVKVVNQLGESTRNLKSNMSGLPSTVNATTNALNGLPTNLRKAANEVDNLSNKNKKIQETSNLLSSLSGVLKFGTLVAGFRMVTNTLGKFINLSNDYIENLNLFNVSMGSMANQAKEFVDNFSNVLGVDPSPVMRYISVFNTLAEGFGIADEAAYKMSKNLTQLSYDMSSFLNIPIEEAMQKIKSGFSGEIEPMRAVGVALDEASLQETAYALGIDKKVSAMTRAQKTELLYYQIMTRTTKMQGDMARTLIQPANALRVLRQEFTQLGRAIGNIFIPMLMAIIPYIQVVVKWLTAAAQAIANFFGFEIDTSAWGNISDTTENISAGIGNIGDSADKTTKELKKMLAPFDELNVIDFGKDSNSGSGSGSDIGVGGSLGIPLPEYDATAGALNRNLKEAEENLKKIVPYIVAVGTGLATWKIGSSVLTFLDKIGIVDDLGSSLRILAGLSLVITGVTLLIGSFSKLIEGDFSADTILKGLAGSALVGVGASLMFSNPVGLIIGVGLAVQVLTMAFGNWRDEMASKAAAELGIDYDGMNFFEKIGFVYKMTAEIVGITDTTNSVTEELRKNLLEKLQEIWNSVTDFFSGIGEWISTNIIKPIQDALSPIIEWINTNIIQPIVAFVSGLWEQIKGPLENLWTQVTGAFSEAWEVIQLVWNNVAPYFQGAWDTITSIFNTAWETIKKVWDTVSPYFETIWNAIKSIFSVVSSTLGGFFSTAWEAIKAVWNNVVNFFSIVWSGIKAIFSVVKGVLSGDFSSAWDAIKNVWNQVTNFFSGVWQGIKNVFGTVATWFKDVFSKAWQAVKNVFTTGGQVFQGIVQGIADVLKSVVNSIIRGINWVISKPFNALNSMIRKLRGIELFGLTPFSWLNTFSVPQIPLLAEGGFPEQGQMFIAREAGPELVGNIGNKTAVANNDQIIEGVRQGVYAAVVEANANNNSRQPINVYIGNKKVYEGYGSYANTQNNRYGANVIKV